MSRSRRRVTAARQPRGGKAYGDRIRDDLGLLFNMIPRIRSANGVPPGSLVSTTRYPSSRRNLDSRANWVVFPLPSIPSRVMKIPRQRPGVCVVFEGIIAGGILFQPVENLKKRLAA